LADDEVVEQLDIEQLAGRDDLNGEGHIGGRGGRVARWVVVDGDNVGSLLAHRVAEDFSFASSTCASQARSPQQWHGTIGATSEDVLGLRIGKHSETAKRLLTPRHQSVSLKPTAIVSETTVYSVPAPGTGRVTFDPAGASGGAAGLGALGDFLANVDEDAAR
jgi:hypothetical protein